MGRLPCKWHGMTLVCMAVAVVVVVEVVRVVMGQVCSRLWVSLVGKVVIAMPDWGRKDGGGRCA